MRLGKPTDYLLVLILSCLLFIPFLGKVHLFDWDEINFAECAREMIVTSDYSSVKLNYQPFWEKPPLFIWMQAISMKVFGVNEFAARFPNAVCGIVTLLVLFHIGQRIYDRRFGFIWVLTYAGSFLPHFYFKSGIIDPWFNLFIFLGIYFIILFTNQYSTDYLSRYGSRRHLILSAIFIGIAILTKGPVALLIFGLCYLVFIISKRRIGLKVSDVLVYAFTLLLTGGSWFLIELLRGRTDVILDFFNYQVRLLKTEDAGHGGPFFYHWIVLLAGCFPASIFALRSFTRSISDSPFRKHFKLWIGILFWVVLILFSLVKTKIVHYSSLCYFPLTFLAAYSICKVFDNEYQWKRWTTFLVLIIGGLIGIALTLLPFADMYKETIINSGMIRDRFAVENFKADPGWTGFESIIGFVFLLAVGYSALLFNRKRIQEGIFVLFASSMLMINLAQIIIVPKIEMYSQRAAIEYFEELSEKDVYVETIGYKSYAYLFYNRKKPEANNSPLFQKWLSDKSMDPGSIDPKIFKDEFTNWLLHGEIDKPAYFISKITERENIKTTLPQLEELGNRNGFVFYRRKA